MKGIHNLTILIIKILAAYAAAAKSMQCFGLHQLVGQFLESYYVEYYFKNNSLFSSEYKLPHGFPNRNLVNGKTPIRTNIESPISILHALYKASTSPSIKPRSRHFRTKLVKALMLLKIPKPISQYCYCNLFMVFHYEHIICITSKTLQNKCIE